MCVLGARCFWKLVFQVIRDPVTNNSKDALVKLLMKRVSKCQASLKLPCIARNLLSSGLRFQYIYKYVYVIKHIKNATSSNTINSHHMQKDIRYGQVFSELHPIRFRLSCSKQFDTSHSFNINKRNTFHMLLLLLLLLLLMMMMMMLMMMMMMMMMMMNTPNELLVA